MQPKTVALQFVDVVHELDQVTAAVGMLRKKIERGDGYKLELLAAELHTSILLERMIQLSIKNASDTFEKD